MQELEKMLEEIEQNQVMLKPFDEEDRPTGIINVAVVKEIIRNHMNDGWIPVEERLPEKGERVLCFFEFEPISPNVICENGYIGSGMWLSEGDKVVAWRPLPEPYSPERSSNEEE